jgi:peptide/nickel transport system substrate-binding protein
VLVTTLGLYLSLLRILALGLLPLTGCLAPDPASKSDILPEAAETIGTPRQSTAPPQIDPTILATRSFTEAPILAERVIRGQLPPVAERLPENPLVVVPLKEIGSYGGTIRRALTGDVVQYVGINKTLSESLMGYERPLANSIQLNLAESYEYLDEGLTAVFRIRKGVKWSDGAPYTVDDILFWYEDMTMDEQARNNILPPSVYIVDGKPMQMEKVDDHTLRVTASKPMGRILNALASDYSAYPKHILSRFHPRYNPEATYEAFRDSTTNAKRILKPGLPRISAWVPTHWDRGQRVVYERNPYYWKVDTEGNQLPYADRIVFTVIQDPQVILLKFINGEIDLFGRYSQTNMYPTLRAEEARGNYELRQSPSDYGPAFYFNFDAPRPALREAFRDIQVRIALSHAMNREELSQIVYHGLLEPGGYSFGPSNAFYSREDHMKYTAYAPEKARVLLDNAGYRDADGDGYRELKDGSRFEFTVDAVAPSIGVDICELVAEQWREIGIKADLNASLRDIIWPRRTNGTFDIHYWTGAAGQTDPLVRLAEWAIMGPTLPFWYRTAFTEKPEWLQEATHFINLATATVDTAQLRQYMNKARKLHADNIPVIVAGTSYHIWGANVRLGNVPDTGTDADERRGWARPVFHEQIFIRQ